MVRVIVPKTSGPRIALFSQYYKSIHRGFNIEGGNMDNSQLSRGFLASVTFVALVFLTASCDRMNSNSEDGTGQSGSQLDSIGQSKDTQKFGLGLDTASGQSSGVQTSTTLASEDADAILDATSGLNNQGTQTFVQNLINTADTCDFGITEMLALLEGNSSRGAFGSSSCQGSNGGACATALMTQITGSYEQAIGKLAQQVGADELRAAQKKCASFSLDDAQGRKQASEKSGKFCKAGSLFDCILQLLLVLVEIYLMVAQVVGL